MITEFGKNMNAVRLPTRADRMKVPMKVFPEVISSYIEPKRPRKKRLLKRCSAPECPRKDVKNFHHGDTDA